MHIICDLDGTLVDTRKAVGAAYFHAGVEMPEEAWGKPWQQWLPQLLGSDEATVRAHHQKTIVYPDMLTVYAKPLPLGRLFSEFPHSITLLTGASAQGAAAALGVVNMAIDELALARYGVTIDQKVHHVVECAMRERHGLYYDDDLETCARVRAGLKDVGARWQVCHV